MKKLDPQICESYMDQFLMLERNEKLPFKMSWHFLTCKECRTKIRMLTKADKACRKNINKKTSVDDPTIQAIIDRVNIEHAENKLKPFSFRPWIICGILMLAFLLCFPAANIDASSKLSLYFYIVFAAFITGYCTAFIAGNIDFFVKKFDKLQHSTN